MTATVKKNAKDSRETEAQKKRRHLRFSPDGATFAFLDLASDTEKFSPRYSALILNQSYRGVGLICLDANGLEAGSLCRVKVGQLAPMKAKVVWKTPLDEQVVKLGLIFLD